MRAANDNHTRPYLQQSDPIKTLTGGCLSHIECGSKHVLGTKFPYQNVQINRFESALARIRKMLSAFTINCTICGNMTYLWMYVESLCPRHVVRRAAVVIQNELKKVNIQLTYGYALTK